MIIHSLSLIKRDWQKMKKWQKVFWIIFFPVMFPLLIGAVYLEVWEK